jgi:hypothetical protein
MRNADRILVGTPARWRALVRPRYKWEYNIKVGLRDMVLEDADWINLAQDRALSTIICR